MAIKIEFLADVARFLSGTKDVNQSLDDVADSLDDITTAGADVDTKVGDDLEQLARTADDSADKISRSFKDAFNDVEAAGRTSSRKVVADVDDVGHKGSATLREFGDEAKQNVAETVSSFDGSASSAVDAIQGTFGGLVSALGPAGVVGAAAAGIGVGLAKSLFAKSAEAAEALKESIGGIFDELRSNEGAISKAFQTDQMADLLRDTEEFKKQFGTDIPNAMKSFGRDFGTIMQGLTGDAQDVTEAQQALDTAWQAAIDTGNTYVDDMGNVRLRNVELEETYGSVLLALKSHAEAVGGGVTANQALQASTKGLTEDTQDSAEAIKDENKALEDNRDLKVEAATSTLDMKDALEDAAKAVKENGTSLDENTRKGRENRRNIIEAIGSINDWGQAQLDAGRPVDEVNKGMVEQRKALVETLTKLGLNKTAIDKYIASLGGIPKKKKTDVEVTDNGTVKTTQEQIDNIKSSGVPVPINPELPSPAKLQKQINAYYNSLSIKVPVAMDQYRSGKPVG